MPTTENNPTAKIAIGIYLIYLGAFLLPPIAIVGVILAYIFEDDATDYLQSHFQYLIRSFWLGILYFGIASALIFVMIGFALVPLCVIWWLIRTAKGLKNVLKEKAINHPRTLLF